MVINDIYHIYRSLILFPSCGVVLNSSAERCPLLEIGRSCALRIQRVPATLTGSSLHLTSDTDGDVLVSRWVFVRDACSSFCVKMDARPSTAP